MQTAKSDDDSFWSNRFHWCVLAAGFLAASEGRLDDSDYVKQLAYEFYNDGVFRDRIKPAAVSAMPKIRDDG